MLLPWWQTSYGGAVSRRPLAGSAGRRERAFRRRRSTTTTVTSMSAPRMARSAHPTAMLLAPASRPFKEPAFRLAPPPPAGGAESAERVLSRRTVAPTTASSSTAPTRSFDVGSKTYLQQWLLCGPPTTSRECPRPVLPVSIWRYVVQLQEPIRASSVIVPRIVRHSVQLCHCLEVVPAMMVQNSLPTVLR